MRSLDQRLRRQRKSDTSFALGADIRTTDMFLARVPFIAVSQRRCAVVASGIIVKCRDWVRFCDQERRPDPMAITEESHCVGTSSRWPKATALLLSPLSTQKPLHMTTKPLE